MAVSAQTMRNIASVRGDLSGSLLDPEVIGIQGIEISNTPTDGQALAYNNSTGKIEWTSVAGGGGGSGDITGVTAGTNLTGGGSSGGVTLNLASNILLTSVTASFSGDLAGTASYATSAGSTQTASYIATASYASNAATAETASYVATASYAISAGSAQTASYATNAAASETAQTASYIATASYASDSNLFGGRAISTFAGTGSNTFTGKQILAVTTTASAPLNIPSGSSSPTSPVNGDVWATSISIATRLNGVTSPILVGTPQFSTTVAPSAVASGNGYSYTINGGAASTSGLYTAGSLTFAGGNANSLQGTGGSVTIRGGTGGTASGSVNIGTTNTNAVNIGASGRTTTVNGNLTVAGNLTVSGTTTTINSTTLEIQDKYILIASGAADAAALNGAGIQFGSVPSEDARIIYDSTNDEIEIYPAVYSATYKNSPYDVAGEATGSITSGSTIFNFIAPRAFTAAALSQYTGSGAATAELRKNGTAISSYPTTIAENDLLTVVATTSGNLAYFTIKGNI
jgi:hypothetical protein